MSLHAPGAPGDDTAGALRVRVIGTVQGVGFRPFVFRVAERNGLQGWVRNTAGEVEIEVEGAPDALARFVDELRRDAPPLAHIHTLHVQPRAVSGHAGFRILPSRLDAGWQAVSPDMATCDDCLRELFDPADRRYRYPFINCTNCGPRFTIIEAMPYDRSRTTMRHFPMCPECRREYEDPRDRRFHAEPVACPVCGPRVWLDQPGASGTPDDPIAEAVRLLRAGHILALKGLGGFHLACDAANEPAVQRLRQRKHRYGKPLALMVPDLSSAATIVELDATTRGTLTSSERPIVLAPRRPGTGMADAVAPGLSTLGVMLPYTPLHHLLLRDFGSPLVMTSGNLSEEPIAIDNAEALSRLGALADAFLLHDRDIRARYDDSVCRVIGDTVTPLRRSRGYAPAPLTLPFSTPRDVVAFGGQQKGAFCLVKGDRAFMSQHVGDLDNIETIDHLRDSLTLYQRLFRVQPGILAHDLHPDYASTRLAIDWPPGDHGARIGVQHHHAHIVSCMAEHRLDGSVIGVAYDGTGYGTDGAIWGGEVLVADRRGFQRMGHLRYVPLLGGESAIRRPYRMTASYLWSCFGEDARFAPFFDTIAADERRLLHRAFCQGLNALPTSSCGRLFDAVSALLGVGRLAAYEGEPAVRLEAVADASITERYPAPLDGAPGTVQTVDPAPLLSAIWDEFVRGVPVARIAAAFHNTLAAITVQLCTAARERTGLRRVCLSGGCFQNALLAERVSAGLRVEGFEVFRHRLVPPNDGGLALGQAAIAASLAEDAA